MSSYCEGEVDGEYNDSGGGSVGDGDLVDGDDGL